MLDRKANVLFLRNRCSGSPPPISPNPCRWFWFPLQLVPSRPAGSSARSDGRSGSQQMLGRTLACSRVVGPSSQGLRIFQKTCFAIQRLNWVCKELRESHYWYSRAVLAGRKEANKLSNDVPGTSCTANPACRSAECSCLTKVAKATSESTVLSSCCLPLHLSKPRALEVLEKGNCWNARLVDLLAYEQSIQIHPASKRNQTCLHVFT